jgi:isopentenyldiphosphate isomerase
MLEEYLDIVDENNNLIGQAKPRSVVHETGLWHRVVQIYVYRENDGKREFLVHLRSKTKDMSPNKWDPRFGGHVRAGESVQYTLRDEFMDETSLDVKIEEFKEGLLGEKSVGMHKEFKYIYFYNFTGLIDSLILNDEVQKVKWMLEQEVALAIEREPNNWSSGAQEFQEVVNIL